VLGERGPSSWDIAARGLSDVSVLGIADISVLSLPLVEPAAQAYLDFEERGNVMSDPENTKTAEVVTLHPVKARRASERKWGKPVMDLGFCIFPSLLLRAQKRLGISPAQLAVLMHLADYWWDVDRKPFPTKNTLGERMGISGRQAQRYIAELEAAGLVKRIERKAPHRGRLSNEYDLTGLVERLKGLEPEFRAVEEEAKAKRRAVSKPGLRPKVVAAKE